jgi:hypothetical protein
MTHAHEPMRSLRVRAGLAARIVRDRRTLHVPPGHHYSPIPSPEDVARAERTAADAGPELPGIDLRAAEQRALLARLVPLYADLPDWERPDAGRFRYDNDWFTYADAVAYALMLRHARPRRVVEVGAGWSSALALDVDERFLGGTTAFTFVDPAPERLWSLLGADELAGRLVAAPVQDVPLATFEALGPDDILFVDSSHVLKAGSDVQFLVDEVYPRLAPGVLLHVHDVFWPCECPASWLATGCSVNEAYAMRALLQGSTAFEVVLWDDFLARFHRDWLVAHMPLMLAGGFPTGGIWLRKR